MSHRKKGPKKGFRPPVEDKELFFGNGDNSMNNLILDRPAEESLAETVRSIFDWFKPRLEALLPDHALSPPGPRLLTPDEAAKVMRVNPQTVMKWCRQQK